MYIGDQIAKVARLASIYDGGKDEDKHQQLGGSTTKIT